MTSKINTCGIYSFPKSGNTFFREIVRAIYVDADEIESSSPLITSYMKRCPSFKNMRSQNGDVWNFYKSHAGFEINDAIIPGLKNDLIVYILRNPLDVFLSQLNFLTRKLDADKMPFEIACASVDEAQITGLIDHFFSAFVIFGTLAPKYDETKSWFKNVTYWINLSRIRRDILLIKYEDLLDNPKTALAEFINRIGFTSIEFEELFKLVEIRTDDSGKFFWKKKKNNYKSYLEKKHLDIMLLVHHDVLKFSGYYETIKSEISEGSHNVTAY